MPQKRPRVFTTQPYVNHEAFFLSFLLENSFDLIFVFLLVLRILYSEEYIPDDFEWDTAELPSPVLDKQQLGSLRFWLIANCMMLGIAMTIITFALIIHGKITGGVIDSEEYATWRVYIYTLNVVAWTVIATAIHKIRNQMSAAIAYIEQYYQLIKFFETGDKSKALTSMVTLPRHTNLKIEAIKVRSKESVEN